MNDPHFAGNPKFFLGLFSFLVRTKGDAKLNVDRDQYNELNASGNPFTALWGLTGDMILSKLTTTPGDEMTIDVLAEEMGLPENLTEKMMELFPIGKSSEIRINLTNGETMMEWELKTTSGMNLLINNLIRLIANVDKFDEFALVV